MSQTEIDDEQLRVAVEYLKYNGLIMYYGIVKGRIKGRIKIDANDKRKNTK